MPDLVDQFEELFRGNSAAYGLVVGQCVREDVTRNLWEAHVWGRGSLGIYPTKRSGTGGLYCRWGCSDIDTHGSGSVSPAEAKVQAKNLVTALGVLGHKAWPELTKSGGYHVYVFASDWTPAAWIRNTLLLAHQLADVPAREVNPKDAEGRTELGNYVNLAYPALEPERKLEPREPGLAGGDHRGGGLHQDGGLPLGQSVQIVPHADSGGDVGRGRGAQVPGDSWHGHRGSSLQAGATPQAAVALDGLPTCGRCGTAVRSLPLAGSAPFRESPYRPRRVVYHRDGWPYCVSCFVAAALNERSTPESFEESAKLYTPPPPPKPVTVRPFSELRASLEARSGDVKRSEEVEDPELRSALEKLGGAGFLRWRDGPRPGEGRNHTLFLLGDDCVQSGLTPDETLVVLVDADLRWGKFLSGVDGHRDGIRYIEDIVRKVHG